MKKATKTEHSKNEAKEAAGQITIRYSGQNEAKPCKFCGRKFLVWEEMEGLEFVLEESGAPVCIDCVKQKAPDIYMIWREISRWNETTAPAAWENGFSEGKKAAGRMILDAIEEPEIERIKRVCRHELKATPKPDTIGHTPMDDVPF